MLVLSPWAGALADRADRRRLLIGTQSAAALLSGTLAALAWSGRASEWTVIAFAAALGSVVALSQPAQLALVASLVPREAVAQAVALNSVTFNLARAAGPTAAAGVIAWAGVAPAFAINAASYLALVVGLLLVRPAPQARAARPRLRDGIGLLRRNRTLVAYLLVVAGVSAGSDPVNTESPAFAHVFGHTSSWAGTLVGAFGCGAVVGAFVFAGRVAGTRARAAATLAAMAAGMVGFGLAPGLSVAFPALALAGFGYLLSNTAATARLQLAVGEHERGRIMALWSIAFLGVRPAASLLDGSLAGAFGVRAAAVALALPVAAGALAAAWRPAATAGGGPASSGA